MGQIGIAPKLPPYAATVRRANDGNAPSKFAAGAARSTSPSSSSNSSTSSSQLSFSNKKQDGGIGQLAKTIVQKRDEFTIQFNKCGSSQERTKLLNQILLKDPENHPHAEFALKQIERIEARLLREKIFLGGIDSKQRPSDTEIKKYRGGIMIARGSSDNDIERAFAGQYGRKDTPLIS